MRAPHSYSNVELAARLAVAALVCALLSACDSGGSNGDDRSPQESEPPPGGTLVEDPPPRIDSVSVAELAASLGVELAGQALLEVTGQPACRVDVHHMKYHTVAPGDVPTIASGALFVPAGTEPQCQGERPILLYAHGTTTERAFDMADIRNEDRLEAILMVATFAAHGYIVVAPNYVGYDISTDVHPYLNADQSAKDMIDALTAARAALPTSDAPTTSESGQVFVTGYSQGGHVAMATHRAMEAAGMTLTASAPMSGPYALSAFGDAVFYGQVNAGSPIHLTMLITGYQDAYGDIYSSATDAFEARYASGIETLLPSTQSRSSLYEQGLLPQDQLFSIEPPDPTFAEYTPATEPSEFSDVFARGFGPDHLITNAFRLAYLEDAQANPDGAFPNTTTGGPPDEPAHPLRRAFKTNDLRNWTPTSPMLLCGGNGDPTVFYMNTQFMQGYWASTSAPVTVLDVDAEPAGDDPYADYKRGFEALKVLLAAQAVAGGADDGGTAAVQEAYHATLVAPFCLAAVRSYFESYVP